jgi:squalene cyclase
MGFDCTIYCEQTATTFLKQLTLMYSRKCSDFNTTKKKHTGDWSHAPARIEDSRVSSSLSICKSLIATQTNYSNKLCLQWT